MAEEAANVPEVAVVVLNMAGDEVARFAALRTASVGEVKQLLHQAGGPPPRWQRLIPQESTEVLKDAQAILVQACGTPEDAAELQLTLVVTEPLDKNILLQSLGAYVVGNRTLATPLLQHDVVFPEAEFGEELLTLDLALSQQPHIGVPDRYQTGDALYQRMHAVRGEWSGDVQVSTFIRSAPYQVALPGAGATLRAAGCTYSPWDRNYGRSCTVTGIVVNGDEGEERVEFGSVPIPWHRDRGDPRRENVASVFVPVPAAHHETVFQRLEFDFTHESNGRRLYFLYALGALA